MKKPKVVKLSKADKALLGSRIDHIQNVPAMVESCIEDQGYVYNKGKGADIPGLEVEVKTRKIEATSPHTVGKMKVDDIIGNNWVDSNLYEKSKQIYRVKYSEKEQTIVDTEVFDYRTGIVQEKLRESYEKARQKIIDFQNQNLQLPRYIRGDDCWAYFENTNKDRPNWYDFRLSDSRIKSLDNMSKSKFNNLFQDKL